MKRLAFFLAAALACALFCKTAVAASTAATLAVAANFKPAMEALEPTFEAATGHDIKIVYGSTGKLYAQIVNGAPFDVFLAADAARPARLALEGRAVPGARFTYALGRLALIAADEAAPVRDRLLQGRYRRLAVANPALAPYGVAAMQVLERLGVREASAKKIVLGENIGQAFAFVHAGGADLGFVALSQILQTDAGDDARYWTPPAALYDPIRQDAILLAAGRDNAAARAFLDYLQSAPARAVIERAGYDFE